MVTHIEKIALKYVRNAAEGATVSNFIDDHDPIGRQILESLLKKGLVSIHSGQIALTGKAPEVGA